MGWARSFVSSKRSASSRMRTCRSAALTPEEMSHLTTLLQKPESAANAPQALADYIRIIREECAKRSGRSTMDALAAARDTYKDKKGYGGKRT